MAVRKISTAWIQRLKKSNLESELRRVNMSSEGTRDELRNRLREYVRSHPGEYMPVEWVVECSTEVLQEELAEASQPVVGDWGQLALRLMSYVRSNPSGYSYQGDHKYLLLNLLFKKWNTDRCPVTSFENGILGLDHVIVYLFSWRG